MRLFLLSFLFLSTFSLSAQQTITATMMHDGEERSYILYIPAIYDGNTAVPLLLNLHGYTSDANSQMIYGDFRPESNTYGFIIVAPDGLVDDQGSTHWNAGWGTGVDDIGFISALIDQISMDYSINQDRVYSTGMSNGGFMSYYLACNLSDKIAAIASVTGTMGVGQIGTCNPSHQIPTMQIHGTSDNVVPYNGDGLWMEPIPNVVDHWVSFNNTDTSPSLTDLQDVVMTDGSTVEHYVYANGDNGATVELYKVLNGGHTWPGSIITLPGTNLDFDASEKVWEFFNKYDINGLINPTTTEDISALNIINISPNPASELVNVSWTTNEIARIKIFNTLGKEMNRLKVDQQQNLSLDIQHFPKGMYFIKALDKDNKILSTYKLLKK